MKKFLLKLIIVTSLTWLASPVFADWTDIEEISISKSRPLFDRTNRVYVVNVQIQNDSDEDIQGPLRMLVKNATIGVTGEDGLSESGAPYFVVSEASLPAGQSVSVKTTFEPNRARLALMLLFKRQILTLQFMQRQRAGVPARYCLKVTPLVLLRATLVS